MKTDLCADFNIDSARIDDLLSSRIMQNILNGGKYALDGAGNT